MQINRHTVGTAPFDLCSVPPWPARTTIKRTFRALERWIEDHKADISGIEYQIARDALHALGELDQPGAETMMLVVPNWREWLLNFIEVFDAQPLVPDHFPSIVPADGSPTSPEFAAMLIELIDPEDC